VLFRSPAAAQLLQQAANHLEYAFTYIGSVELCRRSGHRSHETCEEQCHFSQRLPRGGAVCHQRKRPPVARITRQSARSQAMNCRPQVARGNLPSAILCAFLRGLLCGVTATEFYASSIARLGLGAFLFRLLCGITATEFYAFFCLACAAA